MLLLINIYWNFEFKDRNNSIFQFLHCIKRAQNHVALHRRLNVGCTIVEQGLEFLTAMMTSPISSYHRQIHAKFPSSLHPGLHLILIDKR